jgi:hypothetical protein
MFDRDGELMPVKLLTRDERVGAVLHKYGLSETPTKRLLRAPLPQRFLFGRVWLPLGDVVPLPLLRAVCGRG